MTPIGDRLELELNEEYLRMQNEWFFKWHFIGKDGPVEIDSFRGRPICYGGIRFEGSPANVYWDTIQFYLRKKLSEFLDNLERDIQKYPFDIREKSLTDASSLLRMFAAKIRRATIEKDRILRGNGFTFPPQQDLGSWQGSQPSDVDQRISQLREIYCTPTINVHGVEMPFSSLLKDKVTFTKSDGSVVKSDIPASVQAGKIFVWDATLPIEPGDHFLRQLPSGLVEDFVVVDPCFMAGLSGIGPHFQTKVRRSDQPAAQPQTVINNIVGHNARININSSDSSKNTVIKNSPEVFAQMQAVLSKIEDSSKRELITSVITEMSDAYAKNDGTFKDSYQKFVSCVAEHMTIFAPFFPALSNLL